MDKNKIIKIVKGIKNRNYKLLTIEKMDERDLLLIADELKEDNNFSVSF